MNVDKPLIVIILLFVVLAGCSEPAQNVVEEGAQEVVQSERVAMSAEEVRPLLAGMKAPAFSLSTGEGSTYTFDPNALTQPVVITFYRGGFCPYCNMQLSEMRHAEEELVAMGYQVLFASMDRAEILKSNLKIEDINYTLLSDNEAVATKAFGIAYRVSEETIERYKGAGVDLEKDSGQTHHILPAPATYIIGTDGTIDFAYINPNFRERVHPELVVKAAELALEE